MRGGTAEALLLITCAAETDMGRYNKQVSGPALGIMQVEPLTADWIWEENEERHWVTFDFPHAYLHHTLIMDPVVCAIFARLRYYLHKAPLPPPIPFDLAVYWKIAYNTVKGRGRAETALQRWDNLCRPYWSTVEQEVLSV